MAVPFCDEELPVAHLIFHCSEKPDRTPKCAVLPNDQFDIGRKEIQGTFNIQESTISTHHLRFRCVVYEDNDEQQVAPMVYVRVLSSNQVRFCRAGVDSDDDGYMLSKLDPDVLLNHGDVLHLTPDISIVFQAEGHCAAQPIEADRIRLAELKRFSNQFLVSGRRLGVGGNASVFVAVKQLTKRQVACKIVPLPFTQLADVERIQSESRITQQQRDAALKGIELKLLRKREDLAREYNVLKNVNHPNIITLEKVFCCTYNIYIFQELITGGDLLSYIDQKGALTEPQAAVIIRQVLKAVEFLHNNGVVHRDIKPENILMTSWRDGARIVLTDFGQARTTDDAKAAVNNSAVFRMRTTVGTYGYTAPEVYKQMKKTLEEKGYSKTIDIWSIGCITATLLTNDLIFPTEADELDVDHPDHPANAPAQRWDLSIMERGEAWTSVGRKAKSFIRGCLTLDGSQRLTAKQALLHPWFTNKHYAADIEAAYQRAIQDWTPRELSGNLIDFIDTTEAVPAESRPDHVQRLAEEVKSRHFRTLPSAPPMLPSFFKTSAGAYQQKHALTPLPAISEESEQETVEVTVSPDLTRQDSMFASPVREDFADTLPPPNYNQKLPAA